MEEAQCLRQEQSLYDKSTEGFAMVTLKKGSAVTSKTVLVNIACYLDRIKILLFITKHDRKSCEWLPFYLRYISENLPFVVDCEWNDWNIGECSVSCGGGKKTSTRSKRVVERYGGSSCVGNSTKEENCNEHNCPGRTCF